MEKYKIEIMLSSGTTSWFRERILEKVKNLSIGRGYYHFKMEDDLSHYYPMDKTIVTKLKSENDENN